MTAVVKGEEAGAFVHPWAAVIAAWVIALAALLTWTLGTPAPLLREQLKRLQCWSLDACVVVGLVLGAIVLWRLARELTPADAAALTMVAAVAAGLTLGVAPRTNRIFYDEQIYQSIGQNMADLRLAQMCNDGTVENGRLQCASGEYNKQPYAFPHLLSVAYRAFGVRPSAAFAVNAALMTASACIVYLLVLVLFEDRQAAFFAALLFSLTPEQLVWSATAAVEPSASWALVSALLATACFIRWRSTVALAGAAVAVAYAVQFRAESILIVPVVGVLLWQRTRDEFTGTRLWWAGLVFLVLAAVHVGHLAAVRHEGWGATQDRLSLVYLPDNLRINGWFYFADPRFPPMWTVLAVAGLAGGTHQPGRAAMALYFSLFFGVPLLFYAGSYDYGADVRYSLATYPAIAILGGLGLARIIRGLDRIRSGLPAWHGGAAVVLGMQFLLYVPVVRSTADTAWAARADVAFARSLLPDLRGRTYVLAHNPGMFHVWGISAGQLSLAATNPAHLEDLASRFPGRLYLHWNFWCNVDDPIQRGFCTRTLALASGEAVREHRGRGQHFVLYRLRTRAGEPAPEPSHLP